MVSWLQEMKDEVTATLEKPFAEEFVMKKGATEKYLGCFYNKHQHGHETSKMVWKLYCFEKWKEVFFD